MRAVRKRRPVSYSHTSIGREYLKPLFDIEEDA